MCAVKCHYLFCCVAGYFTDCIYEQDLDEMNIEIIRNLLYKVSSLSFPIHKWLSSTVLIYFVCILVMSADNANAFNNKLGSVQNENGFILTEVQ